MIRLNFIFLWLATAENTKVNRVLATGRSNKLIRLIRSYRRPGLHQTSQDYGNDGSRLSVLPMKSLGRPGDP